MLSLTLSDISHLFFFNSFTFFSFICLPSFSSPLLLIHVAMILTMYIIWFSIYTLTWCRLCEYVMNTFGIFILYYKNIL